MFPMLISIVARVGQARKAQTGANYKTQINR